MFTQLRWFVQGLPFYLQNKMFCQYKLNSNDYLNIDFEDLLKKTMGLMIAKKKLASLIEVEKKSQKVENFVKKYDYKTRVSFTPNLLVAPPLILIYHFLNFLTTTSIQTSSTDY